MAKTERGRTLAEDMYFGLKDRIILGQLQPGERLNLNALAKENAVSLTVVREAVARLVADRLVRTSPQQGYSVWPLSVDDVLDLTRVRTEIERLAVHDSVAHADLNWESHLVAAHHRLAGTRSDASRGDWSRAHADFHEALAAACTSPLLKQLRRQLFDSAELYRWWSVTRGEAADRPMQAAIEHRTMLDAALARDADRVVSLLVDHIRETADRLVVGLRGEAQREDEAVADT